jgi:hypothetical protein
LQTVNQTPLLAVFYWSMIQIGLVDDENRKGEWKCYALLLDTSIVLQFDSVNTYTSSKVCHLSEVMQRHITHASDMEMASTSLARAFKALSGNNTWSDRVLSCSCQRALDSIINAEDSRGRMCYCCTSTLFNIEIYAKRVYICLTVIRYEL